MSYFIVSDVVHGTGIEYHRHGYSFSNNGFTDFLIFTTDFINTSNHTYQNVYLGLYSDFDVPCFWWSPVLTATDLVGYVDSLNLAYEKDQDSLSLNDSFNTFVGIKFLDDRQINIGFHPWDFRAGCVLSDTYVYMNFLSDITIADTPFVDTSDWALYLCRPAPDFYPGCTLSYAFGLVAGHTKDSMLLAASKMQLLYDSILTSVEEINIAPTITNLTFFLSPNLSNGLTNCVCYSPGDILTMIEIFDIQGRLVKYIDEFKITAGESMFSLDLSNLPVGLYFISLSGSGFNYQEKMIIVR
ncbi:T9SS type A sorting domain-containing protein [candidate division WOR-3 bacterium]|nr:T9SS type A sorting domain-containing protein [candidate division WOR-3 bacterium]